jgi:hypothetical protein
MLECYITHKSALEMDVLMLLCDGNSGVQVHTLERMLSTMRHIRGSIMEILFYSYQKTWRNSRKQHIFNNADEEPGVCILQPTVSTVTDTYLNHVRNAHFTNIEEYTKLWSEQHLHMKTCASDHHMKYSGRVVQPGPTRMRDSSVVLYKVQNTANGSFPISIFSHSTSCDDVTVQRAHDFYNIAKARHRHPDTVYAVNDFPTRDGASMMQHLCPHRGLNGSLTLPKDMNIVIVGNDETGHGIHERYRNLGKYQTCSTHGCG